MVHGKIAFKVISLLKDEEFRKKVGAIFIALLLLMTSIGTSAKARTLQKNGEDGANRLSVFISSAKALSGSTEHLELSIIYALYSYKFAGNEEFYGGMESVLQKITDCAYPANSKPITDTDKYFNEIEKAFNIKLNGYTRKKIIKLAERMPQNDVNDRSFLTYNLSADDGKTNIGLCNFAYNILNESCGYAGGAYGQDLSVSYLKSRQSMTDTDTKLTEEQMKSIAEKFGGKPCFDDIGLIKAYHWLDESTGNITYSSNGFSDKSANQLFNSAEIKGEIESIDEVLGLAVWYDGHVGIYVGQGNVIEAKDSDSGVVMTNISENWTNWFQIPSITYVTEGSYQVDKFTVKINAGRASEWSEGKNIGSGGFLWPLPSAYGTDWITSTFGARRNPVTGVWQKAHGAVDIGAPGGTEIYAAADGLVIISRWSDSYGNWVMIEHDDTYSTVYAHSSKLIAKEGQRVKQGDLIALVGTTGQSTGNHLHFEIRENGEKVDPMNFF